MAPPVNVIRSIVQPARAWTKANGDDWNRGGGGARSLSRASQRSASVVTKTLAFRDDNGFEVCDVVDARDHHTAVAPLQHRHRYVLNFERKDALASIADDPLQRDLDHAAMRDDGDVAMFGPLKDLVDCGGDPRRQVHVGLYARDADRG